MGILIGFVMYKMLCLTCIAIYCIRQQSNKTVTVVQEYVPSVSHMAKVKG